MTASKIASDSRSDPMSHGAKIVDARVVTCSPGRNFVTLKITNEDGLTGLGDATLNGRELAVAAYLSEHVCPLLIGRDSSRIEDTWQFLYKGAYWRRGPVTMTAIAAVDVALWDIKGKVSGLPLYQLLGGRTREGAMAYAHASGETITDAIEAVAGRLKEGYVAVRAQVGIPGVKAAYGVSSGSGHYEVAAPDAPPETTWSTREYLRFIPNFFDTLRKELGWNFELLHDVHHRLMPVEAAELGKRLEDCSLFWLEDPVPAELQDGYRLIRRHTTTPIAVGEVFNSIHDCRSLITEQLIDYVRASPSHAGGITHLRTILSLADLYHVRSGFHGASDLSPVSKAAAVHLGIAIPNFGAQEDMQHPPEADLVFPHTYRFEAGYLHPGETPGLGVELDEKIAAEYPYRRAYLPVNRLVDGTIHSW